MRDLISIKKQFISGRRVCIEENCKHRVTTNSSRTISATYTYIPIQKASLVQHLRVDFVYEKWKKKANSNKIGKHFFFFGVNTVATTRHIYEKIFVVPRMAMTWVSVEFLVFYINQLMSCSVISAVTCVCNVIRSKLRSSAEINLY